MEDLFLRYLQAGFFGGVAIVVVLVLRLCLRKAPRQLICVLWLLVAVRLLIPFAPQSSLSLQPELPAYLSPSQQQPEQFLPDANMPDVPFLPDAPPVSVTPEIPNTPDVSTPPDMPQVQESIHWEEIVFTAWVIGVAAMVLVAVISYLRLQRTVRMAVKTLPGVYVSDRIAGAFVMGYWKPRVYLPADLPDEDVPHILAHEQAHIARGDHWWKLLGYVCLCVHWYNPLVWVCYVLFCRDTEVACDERVVWPMELAQRKAYSHALLNCGKRYSGLTAVTLCFGKLSLAQRIKNVLSYRKPGFWITAVAGMLAVTVAICFLTVPKAEQREIDGPGATEAPTQGPTQAPTEESTQAPTQAPTETPTQSPTEAPTQAPTETPTQSPTETPTEKPTQAPTQAPTEAPTESKPKPDLLRDTCGDGVEWIFDKSTGQLTIFGNGAIEDYGGHGVIDYYQYHWWDIQKDIKEVTITSGVTRIGDRAFKNCVNLTSVHIQSGLTSIGFEAFAYCKSLSDIDIPNTVTSTGQWAFLHCESLTHVTLPDSLTNIGTDLFNECDKLTGVTFPKGIRTIPGGMFECCSSLTSIDLPDTVTAIEASAFRGSALREIVIPEGVTEIGVNAFESCGKLKSVTLPASLEEIQNDAFTFCEALEEIIIPANVKLVSHAFQFCTGLKTVYFLGDAPTIDSNAFENVTATAYYPKGNPTWKQDKMQNYCGNITWVAVE